ncbi:amidohydrolase family protein [Rhodococcus sp. 077-4]|uniref:amidohydrolase family protein n=1 Tax=Rhodococcus sp. 077-4 TaxID=2789271 RepID=UPI0039F5097F
MNRAATTVANATVFDGTALREWTSVRFEDGVITDCSMISAAQEGDEVIDARGGTLIPGLIDAHVHLVPGALEQSLTFGVTTVLDMFSTPAVVARARNRASTCKDVADVRSSGIGATAPGGHPSAIYAPIPTLTEPGQADGFVAARIAEGTDYLKIFSGTGGLWPALDFDTITSLVTAAHARGLVVVAHVSSVAGVEDVVSAQVDVIAHVPANAELGTSLVDRIAQADIAVGPTLVTIENAVGEQGGAGVVRDPRLTEMLGDRVMRKLTSRMSESTGAASVPYSLAESNVRRLADAGVRLLAGTDAPNPGTVFGASLHRELELLVRCGVTPARALASATSGPARVFGLADRGRISVGRRADLVLVSGDPLTDITVTRAIERVWRSGSACERLAFVASEAEAEQLDAFDARVAAAVAAVRARRRDRLLH